MKPSKKKRKNSKNKGKASSSSPAQAETKSVGAEKGEEGSVGETAESKERRDLNWLLDAFASVSVDKIESAYREADCDPYKTAGILGAQLEDPGEGVERSERGSGFGKGRRKPKRVVAAATGMVSDVIGKGYSCSPGVCGKGRRRIDGAAEGKKAVNRAYSVEEAEEFLCSVLGENSELGMAMVRDILGQCGCDVEQALDMLLDLSASSYNRHKERSFADHEKRRIDYSSMFAGLSTKTPVENNISSSQLKDKTPGLAFHPFEEGHDHMDGGSRDHMKDTSRTLSRLAIVKPEMQQEVLASLFGIPEHPKYEPNCMNWKKVVKKLESVGQGFEFSFSGISDTQEKARGNEDGYKEFRTVANKHWDVMKTHYQEAALAYSRGERARASYLSEKGKYFRDLAREADERASQEIFVARNRNIKNTVTIDLHGQHVKQAIQLLKCHLLLLTYIPSVPLLRVITGCGIDGVGKGKLKRSVLGLVEKEGIPWSEENAGTVLLRLDGPREYSFVVEDCDSD
ncbi:SMR domain-containing protein At5g58720 [Typha latifolia]|uniref:SMR domain-containing protein At5g58720 n=1 Tax=Typha latifolia TaxID=4733 RepID=UPI003C2AE706